MRWRIAALVAMAMLGASCGSDTAPTPAADEQHGSERSSPFEVTSQPPPPFTLETAGTGTTRPDWGEDSTGTDEPFTVVRRDDGELFVVSVTGYTGYEGGLDQASAGYCCGPGATSQKTTVDGHRAYFTADVADLVVAVEDDLAVRVDGEHATKEELIDVLRRTTIHGHDHAPSVDSADNMQTIGHVDTDLVVALRSGVVPRSDSVPGPASAHSIAWTAGDGGVSVMSLPGVAADLEALVGLAAFHRGWDTSVSIDGDIATVTQSAAGSPWHRSTVVSRTDWGDLLVAFGDGYKTPPPTTDELRAVVSSVRRVDNERWAKVVSDAHGGPGLHADRGAVELERGDVNGVEWLLQAIPGSAMSRNSPSPTVPDEWAADSCLKLGDGSRRCVTSGSGGDDWSVETWTGTEATGLPTFIVVNTKTRAPMMRLSFDDETAVTAVLHRVPGSVDRRAGVLFPTGNVGPAFPTCTEGSLRLELLDDGGTPVACVGSK
jgi:hypothetical protein